MKCILCEQRKAKRYCPAKRGQICAVCCGEKRGVEINCPLDCPYYVEGQRYQQEKITRQRVRKEGIQPYIRRAELYNKNPEIFAKIELALVDLFRTDGRLRNEEIASALELVIKTLHTEKKGIFYDHRSESRIINEIAGRVLIVIREHKDSPELRHGKITLDYAKEVVEEFLKEIKFYMELDSNPQSYLIHISRYHPEGGKTTQSSGSLIISP
ncbi:MAG: hypothetical protein C4291_03460 [Candidatus Dadabacteria bacterium]